MVYRFQGSHLDNLSPIYDVTSIGVNKGNRNLLPIKAVAQAAINNGDKK